MRLKEFLISSEDYRASTKILEPLTLEKASEVIQSSCKFALKAFRKTNRYLYRSMNVQIDAFLGKNVEGRIPMNTNPGIQQTIDTHLAKNGFKALRKNSIFCTPERNRAGMYGTTYCIFPLDGFDFTWSPSIYDLFISRIKPSEITSGSFVQKYGFCHKDFDMALSTKNEILIHGKFVAIKFDKFRNKGLV